MKTGVLALEGLKMYSTNDVSRNFRIRVVRNYFGHLILKNLNQSFQYFTTNLFETLEYESHEILECELYEITVDITLILKNLNESFQYFTTSRFEISECESHEIILDIRITGVSSNIFAHV